MPSPSNLTVSYAALVLGLIVSIWSAVLLVQRVKIERARRNFMRLLVREMAINAAKDIEDALNIMVYPRTIIDAAAPYGLHPKDKRGAFRTIDELIAESGAKPPTDGTGE